MKVLVTGGTGFIGRHALAPLLAAGCEVHVIGRQPCVDPGVTTHAGSLHDRSFVRDVLGSVRPSHLLHLAWYTEHGRFWSSPENLRWLATSLDLVQGFVEAGGRRVVIAGTCAEFSLTSGKISEDHTPAHPLRSTARARPRCAMSRRHSPGSADSPSLGATSSSSTAPMSTRSVWCHR